MVKSVDINAALYAFGLLVEERGPTIRELQEALGLSSTNLSAYRFEMLGRAGLIEQHDQGNARGWRLTLAGRQRLAELEAAQ